MNLRALLVVSCSLLGVTQTHNVVPARFYNSFHHRHAVLQKISPGEVVRTRTADASGRDENGRVVADAPNPLTGPFFVEGAVPGDAIAITFRRPFQRGALGY
jgi:acetamidase/formamidase